MSQHTPGPWKADPNPGECWMIEFDDGIALARTYLMDNHGEEEANARLIAAAPDLLDVVQAFVDLVCQDGHGFHDGTEMGKILRKGRRVLAAIAKAKNTSQL